MKELITLVQPAFDWTWKNSVQVTLLIGLVLLVQKVLGRRLTPRLRYALSLLILLRLLLPAAPPSSLSLENLYTPAARLTAAGPATSAVSASVKTASSVAGPVVPSLAAVAPSPPRASQLPRSLAWAGLAACFFWFRWQAGVTCNGVG